MTLDIRTKLENIAGIVDIISNDEPDSTLLDSGGIGIGWRQACARIAEMIRDRAVTIDRSRNVSGNENGNLLHEHGQNYASAKEQSVVGAQIKWLEAAERYFEYRPTLGEDMAHWANVQNAEMCRKIATNLHSCTATALTEARAEIERQAGAIHLLDERCAQYERRAEQAESALAEAAEVMRPFATDAAKYDPDEGDSHEHAWGRIDLTIGHLRAARAFIDKHGSDSKGE